MKVLPSNGRAVIGIIIVDGGHPDRPLSYTKALMAVLGILWLYHTLQKQLLLAPDEHPKLAFTFVIFQRLRARCATSMH